MNLKWANSTFFSRKMSLQVTELLLAAGANVNARDLWAFTPLHEAAAKGRREVCELLLAHGADPSLSNCHGRTAIEMAPNRELQQRYRHTSTVL